MLEGAVEEDVDVYERVGLTEDARQPPLALLEAAVDPDVALLASSPKPTCSWPQS